MAHTAPLVSVIIPCFNHMGYVRECIQSVIDQDYKNLELIIIDDGSSDGSVNVIKDMITVCKVRFRRVVFRHRPNKGLCSTLNEAIKLCSGEFLSPIASDDLMLPHKITAQVNYLLENPKCAAVFGGARIIKSNGCIAVERPSVLKRYYFKDIIFNRYSLFSASQLVRINVIRAVGGYDPDVTLEDWYMNLKMSELGHSLDSISDILVCYRRHANNASNNIEVMHSGRFKILSMYRGHKLYNAAVNEYWFTVSKELVVSSKMKSLGFFIRSIAYNPLIVFRLDTIKLFVKYLMPGYKLRARNEGS